jgi:hypothetical protein
MSGIKWLFVWNKLRFYFSFILLVFYLVVGGMFLFTDQWSDLLPKGRYITGLILTLFGILRFYVAYKRYANKRLKINKKKLLKENATQQK